MIVLFLTLSSVCTQHCLLKPIRVHHVVLYAVLIYHLHSYVFPCHVTLWLFSLDQSFGSKRETEIQSVEKLPDIRADEGAGPSRKIKLQNESYDGVNTKLHASKDSDGKEFEHDYVMFR